MDLYFLLVYSEKRELNYQVIPLQNGLNCLGVLNRHFLKYYRPTTP